VFALGAITASAASAISNDEWEVCEKGGTEKHEEHKCKGTTTGEGWSWKVLAAGETRKVVSEGGEFKLEVTGKTITCTAVTDKGTITGGKPGTDLAEEIIFTGCTTSQKGCKVRSVSSPAVTFGTIKVTGIKTTLKQFVVGGKEVEGDVFEQKTVENAKKELVKEFVTLGFEAEVGKSCSEFTETKVKGDVAAETVANSGELTFPSTPLEVTPHLEAFGLKATLTGKDTQAVVQAFTEKVAEGWGVRAS
jgi:hypothetical protein